MSVQKSSKTVSTSTSAEPKRITLAREIVTEHSVGVQTPPPPATIDQMIAASASSEMELDPHTSCVVTIPAVTPGTSVPIMYTLVCNDTVGQLMHYACAVDESKHTMRVLVQNNSDLTRNIAFRWF